MLKNILKTPPKDKRCPCGRYTRAQAQYLQHICKYDITKDTRVEYKK